MNAYEGRRLLWTNKEQQLAERYLAHLEEIDDAPPVPETDEPECCGYLDS
jgi:hypothetical protein